MGGPRRGQEDGASLLLALVLIFVIFGVLTAILTYAFAASRTVELYDRDRALHFHADAALEVAVQMVRNNHEMGESPAAAPCESRYVMSGFASSPADPKELFEPGSTLLVECGPTPGSTSGGFDTNTQRQKARDVTFTVTCLWDSLNPSDKQLGCHPDLYADRMVLATARVRYEVDPGHPTAAEAARVPKIVSWQVER